MSVREAAFLGIGSMVGAGIFALLGLRERPSVGIAAWLGYAAAFVVVAGMLAVSFGSYAVSLFVGDHGWGGWDNVFA